jgi:hypothetical protein
MLSIYFRPEEIAALMKHCLVVPGRIRYRCIKQNRRMNLSELEQVRFFESIYWKLESVFRHPVCAWCDPHDWSLDDPINAPDTEDFPPH